MIRSRDLGIIVIAIALAGSAALAQPPENGDGRFSFHNAQDGYLRLDSKTGQVSLCTRRTAGWQCRLVPDERSALEAEIARLQSDNAMLKKELLSRNLPLPEGMQAEPAAPSPSAKREETRNEARLRRVMHEIDKIWKRLVEMVTSAKRDLMDRI